MRFRRQQREPEAPTGVRINHADGRVSECTVVRDPAGDEPGVTHWLAVPPVGAVFDVTAGDTLSVDVLPARTGIGIAAQATISPPYWPN